MVILDAQQFGLAQLHQLRGARRTLLPALAVHRHASPRAHGLGQSAPAGLRGYDRRFRACRGDLRLRKEGDVLGAGQSGTATHLRFLSVRRDEALIRRAKGEAETLLEQDPMLERHPDLARALRAASDGQIEWMQRS